MKSCVKDKEGLSIAVNFSAIFLLNATIRLDIEYTVSLYV